MTSRYKWIVIASSFSLALVQGCSDLSTITSAQNNEEQIALAKTLPNANQKSRAIKKATEFLSSECVLQSNAAWAASAKIVDAFPVYMDGIDDVCYYECKVQSNGLDAGYILVNINRTDVQFPSYSTEGKTTTEEFAGELGVSSEKLQVFRRNCAEFLAEKKGSNGLRNGVVVIERGIDGTGFFKKGNNVDHSLIKSKREIYISRVKAAGGVYPNLTRQCLDEYYMRDSVVADTIKKIKARGGLSKLAASYRWTSDELNGTFASGWHLPKWTQVKNSAGMWSGCGPLAVAMMYSYHRQFNGRTLLFKGLDLNSTIILHLTGSDLSRWDIPINASSMEASYTSEIRDVVFKIGADCHADYGTTGTGASANELENNGELYGDQLGYNVVMDWDWFSDFAKCKRTYDHIRNERPVVVTFDSDGNGSINHTAVAEGAKYCEKKDGISTMWSWWDYEAWYLINYGFGNKREWICAEANYGSRAKETQNGEILEMWFN